MPQLEPTIVDNKSIRLKLFVIILAIIGGITTLAAINVTPKTCIDTTIVAARIRENIMSTQPVGTPYKRPTSESNAVNNQNIRWKISRVQTDAQVDGHGLEDTEEPTSFSNI